MKTFKEIYEDCWAGYKQIGMKKKNGKEVPNCVPEEEEIEESEYQGKKVKLNNPTRASDGKKKFYVYVKDGDKVKKVSFGAKDGGSNLSVKLKDKKARKNFADRHNCDTANDKLTPRYWSCRLPYYAKDLGLTGGGNFFW